MRTTVDLAPELLIAVKKQAAELHRPLRDLIETALRAYLRGSPNMSKKKVKVKIEWCTVAGGLPDVDVSSREVMHDWLRQRQ